MNPRLTKLKSILAKEGLDGLFVNNPANVSYLSNFRISESYLLISAKGNFFITDFRYFQEAKDSVKGFSFVRIKSSIFTTLADLANSFHIKTLGFESKSLIFAEHSKISEQLLDKINFDPTFNLVEGLRQIKDIDELKKIKQAISITKEAFKFIKRAAKPGVKETDLVAELERFIRLKGASASAFELIVASGPDSAFPHARPRPEPIAPNTPLVIDMGVDFKGYKSDLTRTMFLGKITLLFKKSYDIVRRAQGLAIASIKPGVRADHVDRMVRDFIIKRCGSDLLGHSLGHGVGLEVHEAPSISSRSKNVLKEGMVFTIEPAIYLKGKFGIRIEDMVLVTKEGCEVLSDNRDKSI